MDLDQKILLNIYFRFNARGNRLCQGKKKCVTIDSFFSFKIYDYGHFFQFFSDMSVTAESHYCTSNLDKSQNLRVKVQNREGKRGKKKRKKKRKSVSEIVKILGKKEIERKDLGKKPETVIIVVVVDIIVAVVVIIVIIVVIFVVGVAVIAVIKEVVAVFTFTVIVMELWSLKVGKMTARPLSTFLEGRRLNYQERALKNLKL